MYNIEIFANDSYNSKVAKKILNTIKQVLSEKEFCMISLSGGSTPKAIYNLMSDSKINWSKVKFFWGDERYVSHESLESNYRMVSETLFKVNDVPAKNIFPVPTNLSTPFESAESYSEIIKKELNGSFDIMLLGLGTDGHTASLFPEQEQIFLEDRLCIATIGPKKSDRISISRTLIKEASRIFVLAKGEGKAEMLKKVVEEDGQEIHEPIRLIKDVSSKVIWLIDTDASKELSR